MTINLGVTRDMRIDGASVLRTTFNVDQGAPRLSVLTSQAGRLAAVDPPAGGSAIVTADGAVRLRTDASGMRVELANDSIDVSHLIGQANGSVIANSGTTGRSTCRPRSTSASAASARTRSAARSRGPVISRSTPPHDSPANAKKQPE